MKSLLSPHIATQPPKKTLKIQSNYDPTTAPYHLLMNKCYKNEVCMVGPASSSRMMFLFETSKYILDILIARFGKGLHFIPLSYLLIMLLGFLQQPFLLYCRHPQKSLQKTSNLRLNQLGAREVLQ